MTMRSWIVASCAGLLLAGTAVPADAIPSFARKYRVSCSMCHAPVPRLNAFGEQFAANGFEMVVGEEPRDTIMTGDPLLRMMNNIPLAIRLDAYLQGLIDAPANATATDLQTPWTIKLLSGGQIADRVSYYLYFFMSERGEVAGLEDAYVQFTDIAGSGVSLLVGQFQVSDPLFKRELRLQYEDYQPYRVRVGEARADLTYDRGLMAVYSPWSDADVALQLVNGQGLRASSEARTYDRDDGKAVSARFSQGFGPLRVGYFGYLSEERSEGIGDDIVVHGPDLTIDLRGMAEINAQYLRRTDSDPFFGVGPEDTEVDALFAELIWGPQGPNGRWHITGLYNRITADDPIFGVRAGESTLLDRYETAALGLNYVLRRNLRLTGEFQWDLEREYGRLTAGFVSAF